MSSSKYYKGHIPWNKGVKRIHLSPRTEFKRGHTPWNKGIPMKEESKQKLSKAKLGKKLPAVSKSNVTRKIPKVSFPEKLLCKKLEELNIYFVPQYPFEITLVDIAFPDKQLAVYVDGVYWHSLPGYKERDLRANNFLQSKNWKILRFSDIEVLTNLLDCITKILEELNVCTI